MFHQMNLSIPKLRFLFTFIVLFSSTVTFSQNSPRKHIKLDENWKFHFGHASNPEKDFNYSIVTIFAKSGAVQRTAADPRFNDSMWRTLNIPHDWAVELPFAYVPNGDVESHGYKTV